MLLHAIAFPDERLALGYGHDEGEQGHDGEESSIGADKTHGAGQSGPGLLRHGIRPSFLRGCPLRAMAPSSLHDRDPGDASVSLA